MELVSVAREEDAAALRRELPGVEVLCGAEGLLRVATAEGADMVVSALVGAVGLLPTHKALLAGKDVALANKETLVIAGEAILAAAKATGARLLPVDSEHSAIFQAIDKRAPGEIRRIILTASGGPFRGRKKEELKRVTAAEALRHPNWSMGPKITVDCATLMNKGLEVIEARWLFDMAPEKISVTVHPQSIVHSMAEFIDGSVIAQLGVPDMRGPIAYALAYPERVPLGGMELDLRKAGALTFEEPDIEAFPALGLAYDALRAGGTMPAVLSGANEVAVEAFLNGIIGFQEIPALVADAMEKHDTKNSPSVETALWADGWARDAANEWIRARVKN